MRQTRLLVAEPFAIFRAGVRSVLAREGYFEVAEAGDLEGLLAQAGACPPDLVLMDVGLPPAGGLHALARLREICPAEVIVWSFDPTAPNVLAAVRAGADGYLDKSISSRGLVRSLRGAAAGEAPLPRTLVADMIRALHAADAKERARARTGLLSAREREVLDLVAEGARNKQIARALFISEFTVKRHIQNILQKLGLPTRWAAAAFYRAAFELDETPQPIRESA